MVPENGHYWYRSQWRNSHTGEVTWGGWEIVSIYSDKPRGKTEYRYIKSAFGGWRERVDRIEKLRDASGHRIEFQKIERPNE